MITISFGPSSSPVTLDRFQTDEKECRVCVKYSSFVKENVHQKLNGGKWWSHGKFGLRGHVPLCLLLFERAYFKHVKAITLLRIERVKKKKKHTEKRLKRTLFNQTKQNRMRAESRTPFLLQESNRQKTSKLFVFVLNVALKKRVSSKIRILTSFTRSKCVLFNLCVFVHLYWERRQSTTLFKFFFLSFLQIERSDTNDCPR